MRSAIFYEFPKDDHNADRFTHKTANGEVTIILIGDLTEVPKAAQEMAAAGYDLIILCGGMPLSVRAKVRAIVPDKTRVASVAFGIESIVKAADFNRAFMEGSPPAEACIIFEENADPVTERFVRAAGTQHISFIIADESTATSVARELMEHGVGLIELYGEFNDETAAEIIDVVGERAAVGLSGFGPQSAHVPARTST